MIRTKLKNCVHCGWRKSRSQFITNITRELYYICGLTQKPILLRIADIKSCESWLGFCGNPIQLDCFGDQQLGSKYDDDFYDHLYDIFTVDSFIHHATVGTYQPELKF